MLEAWNMFRNILWSQLSGFERLYRAGLGQMELLSTDVNATGHAGTDIILVYWKNTI